MKQAIDIIETFEGPAYQFVGDDGYPTAILIPVIIAIYKNKMWQLPNGIQTKYDDDGFSRVLPHINLMKANEIADKCRENRFINSEHWVEVTEEDIKDYICGSYGIAA